jgi:hypothetical protein
VHMVDLPSASSTSTSSSTSFTPANASSRTREMNAVKGESKGLSAVLCWSGSTVRYAACSVITRLPVQLHASLPLHLDHSGALCLSNHVLTFPITFTIPVITIPLHNYPVLSSLILPFYRPTLFASQDTHTHSA